MNVASYKLQLLYTLKEAKKNLDIAILNINVVNKSYLISISLQ